MAIQLACCVSCTHGTVLFSGNILYSTRSFQKTYLLSQVDQLSVCSKFKAVKPDDSVSSRITEDVFASCLQLKIKMEMVSGC